MEQVRHDHDVSSSSCLTVDRTPPFKLLQTIDEVHRHRVALVLGHQTCSSDTDLNSLQRSSSVLSPLHP